MKIRAARSAPVTAVRAAFTTPAAVAAEGDGRVEELLRACSARTGATDATTVWPGGAAPSGHALVAPQRDRSPLKGVARLYDPGSGVRPDPRADPRARFWSVALAATWRLLRFGRCRAQRRSPTSESGRLPGGSCFVKAAVFVCPGAVLVLPWHVSIYDSSSRENPEPPPLLECRRRRTQLRAAAVDGRRPPTDHYRCSSSQAWMCSRWRSARVRWPSSAVSFACTPGIWPASHSPWEKARTGPRARGRATPACGLTRARNPTAP